MKIYSLVFAIRSTSTIMLHVIAAESFVAADADARKTFASQGIGGVLELLVSHEFIVPEVAPKIEDHVPESPLVLIHREPAKSDKVQTMQAIIKFKDVKLLEATREMFTENEVAYLQDKIK